MHLDQGGAVVEAGAQKEGWVGSHRLMVFVEDGPSYLVER